VLAERLSAASEGRLTVPVPSQGLHLVARFDPSIDPAVALQAKAVAGVEGWLLAETYIRARPIPGFVLGFAGHRIPQLITSAEKLAKASLATLRASRTLDRNGTGRRRIAKRSKPISAQSRPPR
jgi:GntR family transcriptional regulator/MocR family aminotransferase